MTVPFQLPDLVVLVCPHPDTVALETAEVPHSHQMFVRLAWEAAFALDLSAVAGVAEHSRILVMGLPAYFVDLAQLFVQYYVAENQAAAPSWLGLVKGDCSE